MQEEFLSALDFSRLKDSFSKEHELRCTGICQGADTAVVASISEDSSITLLVASNMQEAERFADELPSFTERRVLLIPEAFTIPYTMKSTFGPTRERRLLALNNLLRGDSGIYVTTGTALFERTISPKNLFSRSLNLYSGDDIEIPDLSSALVELGFRRESSLSGLGTFSIKGGIVDIYPFGYENPLRVEFWGDTIDSIREFDIFKQTSVKVRKEISLLPMKEFLPTIEQRDRALEAIDAFVKREKLDRKLYDTIEHSWGSVSELDGVEWFIHWFEEEASSLFEYFPEETTIIWNDYLSPIERGHHLISHYENSMGRVPQIQRPFVTLPNRILLPSHSVEKERAKRKTLYLKGGSSKTSSVHYDFIPQTALSGDLALLNQDIKHKCEEGYKTIILSETTGQRERLKELLPDSNIINSIGTLHSGFSSVKQRVAIYSEAKIFNREVQKKHVVTSKHSAPIMSYDALEKGDIVVHIDHGIGIFKGVTTVTSGSMVTDCMLLEYSDKATIHVPISDFHKVQKYIGNRESSPPQLSKLGSSAWEKKKERTRRDLQEMAGKLIKLYASREFSRGVIIDPDTNWQKEFEESFPYTPTQDQLTTMDAIKKDLESERPMDRLVCGDVGFGKTEVAMRAAFKAVMSGYQVAVLAPTTVLASQHGKTFRERMYEFPVKIATLSRMTQSGAASQILKEINSGEINIIVGTHKILSKSIKYKNLGLVIIDEEQRFGVKQKERFTELRNSINILSMSATPIPRTLHMSMAGIRDLSLITTPPVNRLPIETVVAESHDELIQRAISDEIEQGGQSFVVLNRISGLNSLYGRLQHLLPQARIAVAHGQMDGDSVDEAMSRFNAREFDVLLSTTIIENGIDIPNANTIIVEDSDRLGLSQLYQLRGRVGRSSKQGYAYFFVKSFATLKEDSLKRLKALEQYTDLGSGFQLAMRDLELRGAGNLLGTDQSGSIAAVGFELYCQLLKEEIERLRNANGKISSQASEPTLSIGLQGFFPADYVPDGTMRIVLYQRATALSTISAVKEFAREMADRFGAIPQEVLELLLYMEIKILCKRFYIEELTLKKSLLTITLSGNDEVVRKSIAIFISLKGGNFKLKNDEKPKLTTKISEQSCFEQGKNIKNILRAALYEESKLKLDN